MHRFRVRSKSQSEGSKRSRSEAPPTTTMTAKLEPLPPESDFRTSLIMPSLSRRFTLLRGQNGEPLSIDDVRTRLAHQRANGHVNHVTEEEEEIMIDALLRAHSIDPTASASDSDGYTTATANDGYSTANTNTNDSYSGYDSPQSYGYRPTRTMSSPRKVTLSNASVSNASVSNRDRFESPKQDNGSTGELSFDTYLSNSAFSPAQIRRASLALQHAIQEYEEEEEDEKILAPRKGDQQQREHDTHAGDSPVGYGEAIAWPNDQSKHTHEPLGSSAAVPYYPSGTSSPNYRMDSVNRLPGYVPGMHRPITPRDSGLDTDTNTGTSTPQPVSNTSTSGYEYGSSVSSPGRTERPLPQSILLNKRASTTNSPLRTRPRELSNPDQYDGGGSSSDTTTTQMPLKSALSDKRRPTSPLVDSAYQSAIRAGTPSNHYVETWSPGVSFATHSPSHLTNSNSVRSNHMREESSDTYYSNQSQSRSAASPALPDSPTLNGNSSNSGLANIMSSSWSGATTNVIVDEPVHRTSTPRLSTLENGYSRGVRPYSPHMRAGTPNTTRRGGHSRNGSLADTNSAGRRSPRASHAHSPSTATRPNPLMMSPMLNSSRSSLASTGSSYHSWDEDQLGGKKPHKRGVSVFIDSDSAPWKKHTSGFDVNLGLENAPEPEHIRDVLAGLSIQDMVAVQNRLVSSAVKKRVSVPGVRPLSGPRRRRASAGQSVTSLASPTEPEAASPIRVASPPPVAQTPPPNPILTPPPPSTPPMTKSAEDQAKKANALLHAMMDSIESSPHKPSTPPVTAPSSVPSPSPQPQALAPQNSFSSEDPQSTTPPSPQDEPPTPDTPVPDQDQRQKALADALFGSDSDATVKDPNPGFGRSQSLRAFAMPPVSSSPPTDPDASPVQPKSPQDEKLLAEDVERRAMAATAALKSASTPRLDATNGRKSGKRVNPRQISSPQLVSATTSVDTIALAAAAAAAAGSNPSTPQQTAQAPLPQTQSKLSQRIKKFTGNLRTRAPIPTGEEISPYVIEGSTPSSADPPQTSGNRIPSASTGTTQRIPSNTEPKSAPPTTESPVNAPSTPDGSAPSSAGTPTSAQPRLRGFMARLRKGRKDSTSSGFGDKPRAPSPLGPGTKPIPAPPHIPAAMLKLEPVPMPENMSTSSLAGSGAGVEAPPPPPPPPVVPQSAPADMGSAPTHTPTSSQQVDEEAIRRLYDAASQLGLDHSAINDILVRSQSTSSRSTGWTQASSPMAQSSYTADTTLTPPLPTVLERSASVTTPKLPRASAALGRQLSLKPYNGLPLRVSPPSQSQEDTSSASIVRRTVIFPTPPGRASSEMNRRPSSRHRRNRSGSIHSNKSVQDRAPTPPPSRAPINKRFSKDASPPVPQLPTGVEGTATSILLASRSGSAFSNNNYDSLYEMYAEESQQGSDEQPPLGSAVEVLELSDGQIVWSVVDGLRSMDDEDEGDDPSGFPRISRTSEYSTHDTQQLRFREHQRSASKTSTASKISNEATPKRPETRVYFSNAGDIGTLIDSLTKSHEAGQFNIIPGVPGSLGHLRPASGPVSGPSPSGSLSVQSGSISANSFNSSYNSDADLTLEERLELMIINSRKRAGL